MREVALDTETTGLSPAEGHRIIEVACVELKNYLPTGRVLHHFINPQRVIEEGAIKVHGITNEMVAGKPLFEEVASEIAEFIGESRLVIHNAEFDINFLDYEYKQLKKSGKIAKLPSFNSFCTLKLARKKFPGSPATLDALCKRFEIDLSERELHNALVDTNLLAKVYLELMGGAQAGFDLGGLKKQAQDEEGAKASSIKKKANFPKRSFNLSDEAAKSHKKFIEENIKNSLWGY